MRPPQRDLPDAAAAAAATVTAARRRGSPCGGVSIVTAAASEPWGKPFADATSCFPRLSSLPVRWMDADEMDAEGLGSMGFAGASNVSEEMKMAKVSEINEDNVIVRYHSLEH